MTREKPTRPRANVTLVVRNHRPSLLLSAPFAFISFGFIAFFKEIITTSLFFLLQFQLLLPFARNVPLKNTFNRFILFCSIQFLLPFFLLLFFRVLVCPSYSFILISPISELHLQYIVSNFRKYFPSFQRTKRHDVIQLTNANII